MNDQLTTPPPATDQATPDSTQDRPPAHTRTTRGAASVGWGIALITAGLLWVLATLGVPIPWEVVLPVGVILIGVTLLTGVSGAARGGLVGVGVTLTVVAFVATLLPPVSFTAGERDLAVEQVADLETSYELGAGSLRLDLSDLTLPEGTTELRASVTFGEVVVIVPPEVAVTGDAAVRVGEVSAFGENRAGLLPDLRLDRPGPEASTVLHLDLQVGFGTIEVLP